MPDIAWLIAAVVFATLAGVLGYFGAAGRYMGSGSATEQLLRLPPVPAQALISTASLMTVLVALALVVLRASFEDSIGPLAMVVFVACFAALFEGAALKRSEAERVLDQRARQALEARVEALESR